MLDSLQNSFCSLSGGGEHNNKVFFVPQFTLALIFPGISVYHAILSHILSQKPFNKFGYREIT